MKTKEKEMQALILRLRIAKKLLEELPERGILYRSTTPDDEIRGIVANDIAPAIEAISMVVNFIYSIREDENKEDEEILNSQQ